MKNLLTLVLFTSLAANVVSFDMWEIISEENKPKPKKIGVQSDPSAERIVGGDILRSPKDEREQIQLAPRKNLILAMYWHTKLWKRIIPYKITSGFSAEDHKTIQGVLGTISSVSCLKFRQQRYDDKNWIEFFRGNGCFSGIGRKYWKKVATRISLGNRCVVKSIVVHEVLHSLGFFHEQSRIDRDSYLNVYLNRAQTAMHSNFDKNTYGNANYFETPYDYKSIMHYGRKAFIKPGVRDPVMTSKFDEEMTLGGSVLSKTDILELNRLYQCDIKRLGWSLWTGWSRCIKNYRNQCTKGQVRFCISNNPNQDQKLCPGVNQAGVQEKIEECSPQECSADANAVDGVWGRWGEYTKCNAKCDWGVQTRTRKCNNPIPVGKGSDCIGNARETILCRIKRCSKARPGTFLSIFNTASHVDLNFESGFGTWKANKFIRKQGRASYKNGGPMKDHTSQIQSASGWYAMAEGKMRWGKSVVASLSSAYIQSDLYPGDKCLIFHYQMNGHKIRPKNALSIYIEELDGSISNLPFSIGGHQGNFWKRAVIPLNNMKKRFKIVIEARFWYETSIIAIDDIYFDHKRCDPGLDECKDLDANCANKAKAGGCFSDWRKMLRTCCKSCSGKDPTKMVLEKKITSQVKPENKACSGDKSKWKTKCLGWAKRGECAKNLWMWENCCKSCEKHCSSDNKDYTTKCKKWANQGECEKNSWMLQNCCTSCLAVYKTKTSSN